MKKFLEIVTTVLVFAGCSSIQSSDSLNYPLSTIYSSIEKELSMGIQGYSENHREFYSRPFLVKQSEGAQTGKYRERGRAKVVVLGDGRPYTIEVEVTIESVPQAQEKMDSAYTYDRHDKELAKRLLNRILWRIQKREHDNNIIDDFKPF